MQWIKKADFSSYNPFKGQLKDNQWADEVDFLQHSGQMLGIREGINFGRSRTSFLRKIPKENIRQPLSRQISEIKLKSS